MAWGSRKRYKEMKINAQSIYSQFYRIYIFTFSALDRSIEMQICFIFGQNWTAVIFYLAQHVRTTQHFIDWVILRKGCTHKDRISVYNSAYIFTLFCP